MRKRKRWWETGRQLVVEGKRISGIKMWRCLREERWLKMLQISVHVPTPNMNVITMYHMHVGIKPVCNILEQLVCAVCLCSGI